MNMERAYDSEFCSVSYIEEMNIVFVEWKKYCESDEYRAPLIKVLEIIKLHGCDYAADTRNGFEDAPEDTKWVAEYFMPKAAEYGCKCIHFIIDKENSLKDELEGQANDSKGIMSFRYI